jgi:hypothetical protein
MKKIKIILFVFIVGFCQLIISQTISVGGLEISNSDLPEKMNITDIKVYLEKHPEWRLPSIEELNLMYQKRSSISGIKYGLDSYASSGTQNNFTRPNAPTNEYGYNWNGWTLSFGNGMWYATQWDSRLYVRLVSTGKKANVVSNYQNVSSSQNNSTGCVSGNCVNGKGLYVYESGGKYEGDWFNGKPNGKGIYSPINGDKYIGDVVNGDNHGKGVYLFTNGDKYEGDFVYGRRQGKGVLIYANGDKYEGDWWLDKEEGKGKKTYVTGKVEEGTWSRGYLTEEYKKPQIASNDNSNTSIKSNDDDNNFLLKAFQMGINEAEKNPKPYSYTPNNSSRSSTQKKQKRNVYICTAQSYASCCKLVASTTFGYPKTGCCTRTDGNGCSSGHSWTNLGEEGETQYVCSYCNISVKLKSYPRNSGCCSGSGGCGGHSWREIK